MIFKKRKLFKNAKRNIGYEVWLNKECVLGPKPLSPCRGRIIDAVEIENGNDMAIIFLDEHCSRTIRLSAIEQIRRCHNQAPVEELLTSSVLLERMIGNHKLEGTLESGWLMRARASKGNQAYFTIGAIEYNNS